MNQGFLVMFAFEFVMIHKSKGQAWSLYRMFLKLRTNLKKYVTSIILEDTGHHSCGICYKRKSQVLGCVLSLETSLTVC